MERSESALDISRAPLFIQGYTPEEVSNDKIPDSRKPFRVQCSSTDLEIERRKINEQEALHIAMSVA